MLALAAVIVLVVVLLSSCGGKAPSESGIPSSISRAENSTDLAYDKDADKIDETKYAETILGESEDAGQEYIDETLFIGDSNTARMMSYGFTTLDNDIGIISMGIQMGALTKACVYFKGYSNPVTIPEAVKIMQPRRIIITFGTNNTIGWTAETLVQQYKTALEKIHDAYPYADIIINSIPPVHQYRDNPNITMQTIDKFNLALADMAQELGYKFLNSAEVLKDEKTGFAKWDYTISDGIHLNKDAMEAMFTYFRTHSYITEHAAEAAEVHPRAQGDAAGHHLQRSAGRAHRQTPGDRHAGRLARGLPPSPTRPPPYTGGQGGTNRGPGRSVYEGESGAQGGRLRVCRLGLHGGPHRGHRKPRTDL